MRMFMKRCCYCMYSEEEGTHSYRKPTNIWTNIPWQPRPMCSKSTPCRWKAESGVHPKAARRGPSGENKNNKQTQDELYSMPPLLPEELLDSMQPFWMWTNSGAPIAISDVSAKLQKHQNCHQRDTHRLKRAHHSMMTDVPAGLNVAGCARRAYISGVGYIYIYTMGLTSDGVILT